jgi:hypothetical protein
LSIVENMLTRIIGLLNQQSPHCASNGFHRALAPRRAAASVNRCIEKEAPGVLRDLRLLRLRSAKAGSRVIFLACMPLRSRDMVIGCD